MKLKLRLTDLKTQSVKAKKNLLEVHSSHAAHSSVTHWGWWSFFWLIGNNSFCG
jgi:hypothetical protein